MALSEKSSKSGVEETELKDELSINTFRTRQTSVQAVPTMLSDTKRKDYTTQAKPVNFVVSGLVISGEDSSCDHF